MVNAIANPRTQEARTEEARARLFKSALYLFATKGFEPTSLADISVHAGYSRALAQYHFSTKNALAAELLEIIGSRDMQLSMLAGSVTLAGAEAFGLLIHHCDTSWERLCQIHGEGDRGLLAKGEMLLRAAAMFSPDPVLRECFAATGRKLTASVGALLRHCQQEGVIGADLDTGAAALFYVMSMWGLVNALYVDPRAVARIDASYALLRRFLQSLRTDEGRA